MQLFNHKNALTKNQIVSQNKRKFLLSIFMLVTFSLVLNQQSLAKKFERSLLLLEVFTQIFSYIEDDYFEEKNEQELIDAAINGMLTQLDPYSHYYPKKEYDALLSKATGKNGGLGFKIQKIGKKILIKNITLHSSAAHAGLKVGDFILQINHKKTQLMQLKDIQKSLEGAIGTEIILKIRRKEWRTSKNITLVRRALQNQDISLKLDLKQQIIFVKLTYFSQGIALNMKQQLQIALNKLQQHHLQLKGLILDLRGNPGGILEESIEIADFFLDKGIIVHLTSKNKNMHKTIQATHKTPFKQPPLIVYIDQQSASASELLAAALKDHHRAFLIGENSFGKASVQSTYYLKNGAGLKMTVAHYLSPKKYNIHGTGIEPHLREYTDLSPKGRDSKKLWLQKSLAFFNSKKSIRAIERCLSRTKMPKSCF